MPLYHSPLGLFDFQAEGVARNYFDLDNIDVWSTGIGKTHLAMALACLLFEDDLIDRVLVHAEKNKVKDWVADFERFTDLDAMLYRGDKKRRERLRDNLARVVVGVYETLRNDLAHKNTAARYPNMADWLPGPLLSALIGQRVLIVYDEATRLGNRTSGLYKANEALVKHLRRAHPEHTRTMALTATGFETVPEQMFNLGRIITPSTVGTVADFEKEHVVAKDQYEKPIKFKNLGPEDHVDSNVVTLKQKLRPALKIKSKFDPDVVDQFPKQVEEFESIALGDKQRDFYDTVFEAFWEQKWSMWEERQIFGLSRMIAGYPAALLHSKGKIAQAIVEQVGETGLHALGSAKRDALIEDLTKVVRGQGAKTVVFTFYGQSILPLLHTDLRQHGFNVVVNHGQMNEDARQESIEALRYGDAEVFLTSDAGCRGLNLPEAHYVFNYELPLTYGKYRQRSDRIHRIDSLANIVVTTSYIAEGTVEDGIANVVRRTNEWSDILCTDDDEFGEHMTAADRRRLMEFAKTRAAA